MGGQEKESEIRGFLRFSNAYTEKDKKVGNHSRSTGNRRIKGRIKPRTHTRVSAPSLG